MKLALQRPRPNAANAAASERAAPRSLRNMRSPPGRWRASSPRNNPGPMTKLLAYGAATGISLSGSRPASIFPPSGGGERARLSDRPICVPVASRLGIAGASAAAVEKAFAERTKPARAQARRARIALRSHWTHGCTRRSIAWRRSVTRRARTPTCGPGRAWSVRASSRLEGDDFGADFAANFGANFRCAR